MLGRCPTGLNGEVSEANLTISHNHIKSDLEYGEIELKWNRLNRLCVSPLWMSKVSENGSAHHSCVQWLFVQVRSHCHGVVELRSVCVWLDYCGYAWSLA